MRNKGIREPKYARKIETVKEWNWTAEELQELSDFLDANIRPTVKHTGGLPYDYVFFQEDGVPVFRVFPYKQKGTREWKLYSRLVLSTEKKVQDDGTPLIDNGKNIYELTTVPEKKFELVYFLKSEEIIDFINEWRQEDAEETMIDNPSDNRSLPPGFAKNKIKTWVNKKGVDPKKWVLKPHLLEDNIDLLDEIVEEHREKKAIQMKRDLERTQNLLATYHSR